MIGSNKYVRLNVFIQSFMLLGLLSNLLQAKDKVKLAKVKPQSLVKILGVDGEKADEFSLINIRLDKTPPYKKITLEEHARFIQFALPETITMSPGKFYDGNNPFMKKVVFYQTSASQTMARIFTAVKASLVQQACDAQVLGPRIVLTCDDKMLSQHLPPKKDEALKQTAPEQVAETKKPKTAKKGLLESESPQQNFLDDPLHIAALALLAFLSLIFVALTTGRIIRTRKIMQHMPEALPMKAISHLNLAPKQRLSLVQVGQEKLLLSVSSDQINLITHIKEKETAQITKVERDNFQKLLGEQQKKMDTQAALRASSAQNIRSSAQTKMPVKVQGDLQQKRKSVKRMIEKKIHSEQKSGAKPSSARKKINYQISDEGVLNKESAANNKDLSSTKAEIDDVTKLIREKLKVLPKL